MGDVVQISELRGLLREGERRLRDQAMRDQRLRLTERWRIHWVGMLAHPALAAFVATCSVLLGIRAGVALRWPGAPVAILAVALALVSAGVGLAERARRKLRDRVCALPFGVAGVELMWSAVKGRRLRIVPLFKGVVPSAPTYRALLAAGSIREVQVQAPGGGVPSFTVAVDRPGSAAQAVEILERVLRPLHAVFPLLAVRLEAPEARRSTPARSVQHAEPSASPEAES